MTEWKCVQVHEIASQITDGDHHTPVRTEEGVPLLSARNVVNGSLLLDDIDFVPKSEYERMIRRCDPQPHDILISCSGSIGRVCEVPPNFQFALVRSVALVKLDRSRCDSAYIAAAFRSDFVQRQIVASQLQAAQPNLFQGAIKELQLLLPPLPQQRKIARILTTLDNVIAQTEALIAKYQAIKQGLMHDLFTRGVDATGKLRPPQSEAPELYKQSDLGWIPKEWEVCRVDEVGSVKLGRQRSPDQHSGKHTMPYLRVANVFDGWIDYSDVLEMDFTPAERETFSLLPNDILLNEGQSVELVGRSSMYLGEPNRYCFQNTLVRFRCSPENDASYWQDCFQHGRAIGRFMQIASQTTSVAHLGADRFARMMVACPPLEEQLAIAERIRSMNRKMGVEEQQRQKLRTLKTGLMQDLLTGRVQVNTDQIPEGESAAVKDRPHGGGGGGGRIFISSTSNDFEHLRELLRRQLINEFGNFGCGEIGSRHMDKVLFAAYCPPSTAPGRTFVLEIVAYLDGQGMDARGLVKSDSVEVGRKSAVRIVRDSDITILVQCPGLVINDPIDVMEWNGTPANSQFIVHVPIGTKAGEYHGTARIVMAGIQRARFVFTVVVASKIDSTVCGEAVRADLQPLRQTKTVFASYASADRLEVLKWMRGAESVGAEVFLDVKALRQGENWQERLRVEILRSDLFCLFWSGAAKRSKWVEREWRLALAEKGCDFIQPIPLVDPRDVAPPSQLGECAHFNDMNRISIEYERFWRDQK